METTGRVRKIGETRKTREIRKTRKIILLSLIPNTIGDNLFLTPIVRLLKNGVAGAEVHLTVSPLNASLFDHNPYIGNLIVVDELKTISQGTASKMQKARAYLKMLVRLILLMRKEKYDNCFVLYPNFFLSQLIPWLAGIPRRIGFAYNGAFFSSCLTSRVPSRGLETGEFNRHFCESLLDLLRAEHIPFTEKDVYCEVFLTPHELSDAKAFLKKGGVKKKFVVFVTEGRGVVWAHERFASLGKTIHSTYGYDVLLTGSPAQRETVEDVNIRAGNVLHNIAGKADIRMTAAIEKCAALVIAVDTGTMHLAAAVGTPVIGLFGPRPPEHSRALGKNKSFNIYKKNAHNPHTGDCRKYDPPHNCADAIKVEDVLAVIRKNRLLK